MEKNIRVVMEIKDDNLSAEKIKQMIYESDDFLARFSNYKKICIQCHDNPDADALATGFALYQYFTAVGSDAVLFYSGKNKITKPNLLLMIKELEIPVQYLEKLPECDLLMLVDCQYGEGNVTKFEAPVIAMIDHHQCGLMQNENAYIKPNLGSCATVVWNLFQKADFDIHDNIKLSTALYYGLYSDTNQFGEIFHPLDKDMRDQLIKDDTLLFRLMNTNLSIEELNIASNALASQQYNEEYHFSVIPSKQCDPNILGIISDFVIQVKEIDTCLAFNANPGGYKLSVRSCIKEIKANELVRFLCEGVGNGGGHLTKAGGFIAKNSFEKEYPNQDICTVLQNRMSEYCATYDIIYAKDYELDKTTLQPYRKKAIPIGVAIATDFLQPGTPILIRTLEGDVDITVEKDLYFMIGVEGEVYPIHKEKFEKSYSIVEDREPEFMMEYAPTIRNNIDGEVYKLLEHMHTCMAKGTTRIFAKQLERNVKVFTAWDENKYYSGNAGDFIACREDDVHDIYVIRENIFYKTYEKIE